MGEGGNSHGRWMGKDKPGLSESGLVDYPLATRRIEIQKKQINIPYLTCTALDDEADGTWRNWTRLSWSSWLVCPWTSDSSVFFEGRASSN